MKISSKPAILGKSLRVHNVRSRSEDGEEGGDAGELIAARDIPLKKIMVTKSQFNKLLGSDQAYNSFFNDGTKPPEPAFESIDALKLKESYKDCSAILVFGVSSKTIEIDGDAKIKNIRLKPCTGGVAELSCTLQAPLPRKLETLDLEQFIGKEINVTLKFGSVDEGDEASKQDNLALEGGSGDEKTDKTRVLTPGQAEREAETSRQLGEALRGLEKQDAEEKTKNGRKPRDTHAH